MLISSSTRKAFSGRRAPLVDQFRNLKRAAACTNEEIWQENQEKNIKLRSNRSKRANTPSKQAVPLLQKIKFAKFDETVEVHMRLGVDPKHADQMVRGTVVMPNGLGKSKKVLVIASGDKQREATKPAPISSAARTWSTRSSPKAGPISTP